MAKKNYYESGNMFLKTDTRISKKNNLSIENSSGNKFRAKLFLSCVFSDGPPKLEKDSVNGRNVIHLKIINNDDSDKDVKELTFFQDNKEDILSTLRIAREYAKDNKMSLYIDDIFSNIPITRYSDCVLDKETNTVYPILYDEMKELSEHNIPITFQPRGGMKGIVFSFPEELKADIDLSYDTNIIDISLQDKNNKNNISYNMSNISLKGIGKQVTTIWDKYKRRTIGLKENNSVMDIISLPEHKNGSEYYYQVCSTKPVIFKDTNLDERNIHIISKMNRVPLYNSIEINKLPIYTFIKRLDCFYNNPKELSEDDKIDLKEKFIFMKQNNCDIIEQSKILLKDVTCNDRINFSISLFNDRDKINNDIEKLIGNEIDYAMT